MPIHLLWGDDSDAINRAIEALIKKIVHPSWESLNISRLDGTEVAQAKQALQDSRTPPFGEGSRLVILKRSPFCNNCPNEISEQFEETIKLIPKSTHLILNNINKPDGRLKTTKALKNLINKNIAFEQKFILPAIWDQIGQKQLIENIAAELKLNIEENAKFLLVEAIGNDSSRIYSELSKLALLAESKEEKNKSINDSILIKADYVKDLITGITTNAVSIGNLLLEENIGEAIAQIDILINNGEPSLRIISTLTNQVRGWLWTKLLEDKGEKDVGIIAQAAGIANPKRIYIMRKQIQGKSTKMLLVLLSRLLDIEAAIKKGVLPCNAFRDAFLSHL